MADYYQRFLVPEVPALFTKILNLRDLAATRGLPRVAADLDILTRDLAGELEGVAASTAQFATERARDILEQKRRRPDTDSAPHLRDVIESRVERPVLAEVGVADLNTLAQARRRGRTTGGEYWRAQELGLREGFVGRHLHGVFQPSGTPPGPSTGDTGFDVTKPGEGGEGGWMTISREIEPKHFLRDASHEAAARYIREVRRITRRAETRIVAIAARIPAAGPFAGGRRAPGRGRR